MQTTLELRYADIAAIDETHSQVKLRRRTVLNQTEEACNREMSIPVYPIRILEYAVSDAVAKLGIGGYIPARDIVQAFNPISAGEFAQIMYATDLMSKIFDDEQAMNVDNVKTVIEQNRFETSDCFNDLIEVFRAHFKRLDHVQFQ